MDCILHCQFRSILGLIYPQILFWGCQKQAVVEIPFLWLLIGFLKWLILFHFCRNLPFGGRVTRGSWVRLPRKENVWSHHQRLFEENVGKNRKKTWSTKFECERFESCIYARGRYQHPAHPSQWTTAFNQVCKHDFNLFYFPFLCFYVFLCLFVFFYLLVVNKGVSLAHTYSSIVIRKSDLRSSLRTKRWLSCFYPFLQDIF